MDYLLEYSAVSATSLVDLLIKGLWGFLLLVLYIFFSWLLLKLIVFTLNKTLHILRIHKMQDLLDKNDFTKRLKLKIQLKEIIITFVKIFVILILIVIGSELFGLEIISQEISNIVRFLPKLLAAIAILVGGTYFASLMRKKSVNFLKTIDFSGARFIGTILFYVIFVFIAITALNQAGINTSIITNNISIIFGSIMLVFVLALGLGSKDIVGRLLNSFYARKNIEIGKKIRINNKLEGYVVSIDNVYLCLLIDGRKNYIPINTISESIIEILD